MKIIEIDEIWIQFCVVSWIEAENGRPSLCKVKFLLSSRRGVSLGSEGNIRRKQCWGSSLRSCHFPADRNHYRVKLSSRAFMASMNRFHKWANKNPRPWLRKAGSSFRPQVTATLCLLWFPNIERNLASHNQVIGLNGSLHCVSGSWAPRRMEGVDATSAQCKSVGCPLLRRWGVGFVLVSCSFKIVLKDDLWTISLAPL